MPLEQFQKRVLRILAKNRNPDSYVAGALVINEHPGTPRYSGDIDIFHSEKQAVLEAARQDAACLTKRGMTVDMDVVTDTFVRAVVIAGDQGTRLDWVIDSAYRFFPVEPSALFGYKLNYWDACVNKLLALAGRVSEQDLLRDTLDVLEINRTKLSMGALCWAAVGKDPGWTPELLLNTISMRTHFRDEDFLALKLREHFTVRDFKVQWLAIVQEAKTLIRTLPQEQVGCLYLDSTGRPVTPDTSALSKLTPHYGTLGGAWPTAHKIDHFGKGEAREPD